jgi:hypothetical protein
MVLRCGEALLSGEALPHDEDAVRRRAANALDLLGDRIKPIAAAAQAVARGYFSSPAVQFRTMVGGRRVSFSCATGSTTRKRRPSRAGYKTYDLATASCALNSGFTAPMAKVSLAAVRVPSSAW